MIKQQLSPVQKKEEFTKSVDSCYKYLEKENRKNLEQTQTLYNKNLALYISRTNWTIIFSHKVAGIWLAKYRGPGFDSQYPEVPKSRCGFPALSSTPVRLGRQSKKPITDGLNVVLSVDHTTFLVYAERSKRGLPPQTGEKSVEVVEKG